ncbi:MAG: alpha-N-arabinofuranosidase [Actinomycetia bacterium]|nr:alpha-N-arabinofuranosidase [Actinomycetes bacterium]MCP5031782.1 alpha-N-arabinofuranosidase [Actinomycetes bacterium]
MSSLPATTITLHRGFPVGPVDPRIFGGFLEHMGRAVYEGVFDPNSAHADQAGLRRDVLGALDRLKMPVVRYPGGNFVSGYHWEDGVGDPAERPTLRELAWSSIETNQFGTDEFMGLCRKLGWTPMMAVNLGTGTPEEARNWVEYCNSPTGSRYADMREANGHPDPYGVPLWCLGNEMDGPWQLGHGPAAEYAVRALQAARMMKRVDPSIELVASGSSMIELDTYLEWDRQVLEYLGGSVDYISLHRYVGNERDDTADYLAVTASIDAQIEAVDGLCLYVQAKRRGRRRAYLCFDEWNVWYKESDMNGAGQVAPHLIEERYNLEDALVVAGFLNSFIRHADVVRVANLAQLVNVVAPIQTRGDDLLIQSIFHVFEQYAKRRSGISLRPSVDGPTYQSESYGSVDVIDTSAIVDDSQLHVFVTNRSLDAEAPVEIELADMALSAVVDASIITGAGPKAENTFDDQTVVCSAPFEGVAITGGRSHCILPPLSVTALTFSLV